MRYIRSMAKRVKPMHVETAPARRGRPPLSADGSEQVALRIPSHILRLAEKIVDEQRGIVDRATVLRQFLAVGADAAERKTRK